MTYLVLTKCIGEESLSRLMPWWDSVLFTITQKPILTEDLQDEILDAIHFEFEQRIGVYADDNGERLARYLATGK